MTVNVGRVAVAVGTGVIGENFFGFEVAVDTTRTEPSEGNVCVGAIVGIAAEAALVTHPLIKTQTTTVKIRIRFIKSKYIGRKLSRDEILEGQPCEDFPGREEFSK